MSDSESDWSDVPEDEANEDFVLCLFCSNKFSSVDSCFEHIQKNHEINIKKTIKTTQMSFYSYIKFINYIRKNNLDPSAARQLELHLFEDEQWLIPSIENDLLLQYDVESELRVDFDSQEESSDIVMKLGIAEERAKLAEEFLERTLDDLNVCRQELNALLLGKASGSEFKPNAQEQESEGYFSSYAHFGIHEEMLKDKVRTVSYRDFILNNTNIFKNAKVLDIGCGTSVLSMFAAQAGAAKVLAVDNSDVAYQAMDIVKENNLDSIIEVKKGKAEDIEVSEKVDVIISEWMGYFLLFESMLDTVLYCRDKYLSEKGCIYPDKCNIQLAALCDDQLYESKLKFWDDVYGFKMTAMKSGVLEEPLVTVVESAKIMSESCVLKEFDLMKISTSCLDFDQKFTLKAVKKGTCSAVVGYFDIKFEQDATHPVLFSTSPHVEPTHWKQTVFFLKKPILMDIGDVLIGRIICKKNKQDHRALDIAIFLYDKNDCVTSRQHYVLS